MSHEADKQSQTIPLDDRLRDRLGVIEKEMLRSQPHREEIPTLELFRYSVYEVAKSIDSEKLGELAAGRLIHDGEEEGRPA